MVVANNGEKRTRVWRTRWAAIGAAVAVSLGGGGLFFANAASSPASSFVPVDAVRVVDSRQLPGLGILEPLTSGVSVDVNVVGTLFDGLNIIPQVVPPGATAVALNVTLVGPTADGFLSVRAADSSGAPSTSSINARATEIVANAVTVRLPTAGVDEGDIELTYDAYGSVGPTAHVLVDIVGYYVGTEMMPTEPTVTIVVTDG